MAITESTNLSSEKEFMVYVNLRSKSMPHIRLQKRVVGIRTKNEALRIEKNLLKELSQKIAHQEGHGFTWRMVVLKWASVVESDSYFEKQYNPAVIKDYIGMMNNWTKSWLDRPANELSRGDGREVLDQVLIEGKTKAFQKRLKNTINMIFNWGLENRIIRNVTQSPVHGLKIILKEEKRPEILKVEEIRKLLHEARKSRSKWFPIWGMALLTGMRNGELYALKWSDVDFERDLITVQRSFNKRTKEFKSTKAGYWRSVPISSELRNLLMEFRKSRSGEFVLPRLIEWRRGEQAKHLREFCTQINLHSVKFHTLRACFATQLISSGAEPIKVMKVCGWQDLKTMARYIRLAGVDEKGLTNNLFFLKGFNHGIIHND
jgi:integrase